MSIRSRNKVKVEFSMASMTDIIFLLLIFFIIASTMISPHALKVLLPKSAQRTTGKQNVSVTITPDIKFYVNANEVMESDLEVQIKQALAGEEKPGIVLHCDKTVAVEHAVKVMEIANRNKFELVLATSPK